jgi:tetratricopeptide (TPR) repeat protein
MRGLMCVNTSEVKKMAEQGTASLRRIIERRRRNLLRRHEEIQQFEENLTKPDSERFLILNLYGPEGMGKTWLMLSLQECVEERQWATAWSDKRDRDILASMDNIVQQLERKGMAMASFRHRFRLFHERLLELGVSPNVPQEFSAVSYSRLMGTTWPPQGGSSQYGEHKSTWISHIARAMPSSEEKDLVLDPVLHLSVAFVTDIQRLTREHSFALFLDDYNASERDYLDEWLRDLLDGSFGELQGNILVVVASRDMLSPRDWSRFGPVLERWRLGPLSPRDAEDYVKVEKKVKEEAAVKSILSCSQGIPKWLDALTDRVCAVNGKTRETVREIFANLFLEWEAGSLEWEARRRISRKQLLDIAVPRYLDDDILSMLDADDLRDFLEESQDLVPRRRESEFHFNPELRAGLSVRLSPEDPERWAALHQQLRQHHQSQRESIYATKALQEQPGRLNKWLHKDWCRHKTEELYHTICQAPTRTLPEALKIFLEALEIDHLLAMNCAKTIRQAGHDAGSSVIRSWGERLVSGMDAYIRHDIKSCYLARDLFEGLALHSDIDDKLRLLARAWKGECHRIAEEDEEALGEFEDVLKKDATNVWALTGRVRIHIERKQLDTVGKDLEEVNKFSPNNTWGFLAGSEKLATEGKHEAALKVLNDLLEINPESISGHLARAVRYQCMGRLQEAINDFTFVQEQVGNILENVTDKPWDCWAAGGRASIYQRLGHCEKAIEDYKKALEGNPDDTNALSGFGFTYLTIGDTENADRQLKKALHLNPRDHWSHRNLGYVQIAKGNLKEAREQFEKARELEEQKKQNVEPETFAGLGECALREGNTQKAFSNLQLAIKEERPEEEWNSDYGHWLFLLPWPGAPAALRHKKVLKKQLKSPTASMPETL